MAKKKQDNKTKLNGRKKIRSGEVDSSKVRDNESAEVKNHQKISKF